MEKVNGYIRVSTITQAKMGFGLETQREAIISYCKENQLELVNIYEDKGISGTKINRAGLTDLLSNLDDITKIIVLNTSRLWRDNSVKIIIKREFEKVSVDVVSIEQPTYSIYNKDPKESLINGMTEIFDQYDRDSIVLKLAKGRLTKAKSGQKPCGTAPIGYKWDNGIIVIDKDQIDTVKLIYKKYLQVGSLGKVKKYLDENDYLTNNGKFYSKQSIKNILTNDFYKGTITHGDMKKPGQHEIIINNITWGKVQSKLKSNSNTK